MVIKSILFGILVFVFCNVGATFRFVGLINTDTIGPCDDVFITYIGTSPVFDGDLEEFINALIIYPRNALESSLEGVVYVNFWVDTLGRTYKHRVFQGVNREFDQEALRVARLMHFEKPATQGGKPISVPLTVRVDFRLSDIQYLLNNYGYKSGKPKIYIREVIPEDCRDCLVISFLLVGDTLRVYKITYTIFYKKKKRDIVVSKMLKKTESVDISSCKCMNGDVFVDERGNEYFKEKDFTESFKTNEMFNFKLLYKTNLERLKVLDFVFNRQNKKH